MTSLKGVLAQQIPVTRQRVKDAVKQHGSKIIDHVSLEQIFGGMRGVCGLVCDTSSVIPDKGLIVRGRPIGEVAGRLPEEVFWLLLTGDLPDADGLRGLQAELAKRAEVPPYVWKVLDAMPADAHPMSMLSAGIVCMQRESIFHQQYESGLPREEYWEATFEDSLNIIARVPAVAAAIYRRRFNKGPRIPGDPALDWGANYAHMLGVPDPTGEFANLIRLFLALHCDHENGNVSAMTAFTVNSALSDLYYAYSAGLNGLAGPLHGLANQECLMWVMDLMRKFNGTPTKEQTAKHVEETLKTGKIPGYGHGVLRVTDPRFTCFYEFGRKHCPDDPVFKTVAMLFEVVPDLMKKLTRTKDPWPNVDAASGSLLNHYGLKEPVYYTVLFGISRALGICAQAIWYRALLMPICRPKSATIEWLEKTAENASSISASKDSARHA